MEAEVGTKVGKERSKEVYKIVERGRREERRRTLRTTRRKIIRGRQKEARREVETKRK